MTDIELAWAAGFFDGEGTFSFSHYGRHGYKRLHVSLAQGNPEPLERFCKAVGAGHVTGPYKLSHKNKNWSDYWNWAVGGSKQAIQVYTLLSPYLSTPKRIQGQKAIEAYQEYKNKPYGSKGAKLNVVNNW